MSHYVRGTRTSEEKNACYEAPDRPRALSMLRTVREGCSVNSHFILVSSDSQIS